MKRYSYKPKNLVELEEFLKKEGYYTKYYPKDQYTHGPSLIVKSENLRVGLYLRDADISPEPKKVSNLTPEDRKLIEIIKGEYKHKYNPQKTLRMAAIFIPIADWVAYWVYKRYSK